MNRQIGLGLLVGGLLGGAASAQAALVNTWVQFVPGDMVRLRAIDTDPSASCPAASVDGQPVAMNQRGDQPTAAQQPKSYYPIKMCESDPIPAFGHTGAMIGGVALKMPVANPHRILVVGDTGCRVTSATSGTQNCNDPIQFPLQYVANYAATFKPDLIVHVGDFFYREQPCPTGFTGCAGTPAFDNWDSWYADWFGPAKNLLAAAPVALSRGNHESCNRGARGWFRLLDPNAYDANAVECVGTYTPMPNAPGTHVSYIGPYDVTPPYAVRAGQVTLLMFDSSDSNTSGDSGAAKTIVGPYTPVANQTLTQVYEQQLGAILPSLAGRNVFYITHKAPYDVRSPAQQSPSVDPGATYVGGDFTQQNVLAQLNSGRGVPAAIKLFIDGHDHQFQAVNFNDPNYAPQLLTGNSGTLLDQNSGTQPQTFAPDATYTYAPTGNGPLYGAAGAPGMPLISVQLIADQSVYGFTVMDAITTGYNVTAYNVSAMRTARCAVSLSPRSILCAQ